MSSMVELNSVILNKLICEKIWMDTWTDRQKSYKYEATESMADREGNSDCQQNTHADQHRTEETTSETDRRVRTLKEKGIEMYEIQSERFVRDLKICKDQMTKELMTLAIVKSDREEIKDATQRFCLLYTSPSPRDLSTSRMPSSA